MIPLPITVTFIAVFLWTFLNLASKKVATGIGIFLGSVIAIGVGIIPMLIATIIVGVYDVPLIYTLIAVLAGAFAAFGSLMGFRPLATEQLSNTAALQEIYPPILILFGVFVLGENLTLIQAISIIVIFLGALLVITTEKLKLNRKLLPALISPISWAFYWIVLAYAIDGSGTFALPVLVSRVVATVILVAYVIIKKKEAFAKLFAYKDNLKQTRTLTFVISIAVLAGLADGIGDTLFSYTYGSGFVAIGSAISGLAPIFITIISFYIYKDRLTKLQLTGLVIMVLGAVALSLL